MSTDDGERYLSAKQVAEMTGVGVDTLEKWRAQGLGPRWYRLPGTRLGRDRQQRRSVPRYRLSDVELWLATCRVNTKGGPP